jgi:hypothetical protein
LFDLCETNEMSPTLYCSEVVPDLESTVITALEVTTIDNIRSHDSSSVSSTYFSKLSSMAWKSDTQWRTHRSSSSKATPDWSTHERTGPYSYRDYGDDQRTPWPREEPVRLVANTTYADEEDDKGFEYLDEREADGTLSVGWTWQVCCERLKTRAAGTKNPDTVKADSPSNALFEVIKRSTQSRKSQYEQRD